MSDSKGVPSGSRSTTCARRASMIGVAQSDADLEAPWTPTWTPLLLHFT